MPEPINRPAGRTFAAAPWLADPETPQNQFDDVSDALTPEERLWAVLYRASGRHGGAYADSIPRWSWNLIADDMPNLDCLKCAFERYMRDKSANSSSTEKIP
jgi:hypothetical protein